MSELNVGDLVLTVDTNGELVFSPIILDLDTLPNTTDKFLRIWTSSDQSITLSPNHLIYRKQQHEEEAIKTLHDYSKAQLEGKYGTAEASFDSFSTIFSMDLKKGDLILVYDGTKDIKPSVVVDVEVMYLEGIYSPLTTQGNIVVDDVLASCYADFDNHALQHFAWAPFRWWQKISELLPGVISSPHEHGIKKEKKIGLHWYAQFLTSLAETILPWKMLDPETYINQGIIPSIQEHLIFHTGNVF